MTIFVRMWMKQFHEGTARIRIGWSEKINLRSDNPQKGVDGCKGAWASGYASWLVADKPKLASEETYNYTAGVGTCRTDYEEFYQGAKISEYYSGRGNEENLKALVYLHGAVLVAIAAQGTSTYSHGIIRYRGGVFSGCSELDKVNHAVVVVGYGTTEEGLDYWLVKNSWGPGWGDQGYIKIQRGVNMCGIGTTQVTLSCCEVGEKEDNTGFLRPC